MPAAPVNYPADILPPLFPAWSPVTGGKWRPDNPAANAASAALVIQDLFGGEILKTRVDEAWHFYNRIDGVRHNPTETQLAAPIFYQDEEGNQSEAAADTLPECYTAPRRNLGLGP